jgi:hypothetical protein
MLGDSIAKSIDTTHLVSQIKCYTTGDVAPNWTSGEAEETIKLQSKASVDSVVSQVIYSLIECDQYHQCSFETLFSYSLNIHNTLHG